MTDVSRSLNFNRQLLYGSLLLLPFVNVLGSLGLLITIGLTLNRQHRLMGRSSWSHAWLLLGILLIISCCVAYNFAEAWIGLANFIPFFLLCCLIPYWFPTHVQIERLTLFLVGLSLPISLVGLIAFSGGEQRPGGLFANPNTFASYLVVVLGLQLGLVLQVFAPQRPPELKFPKPCGIPIARASLLLIVLVTLVALALTGSRGGLMAALIQGVMFLGLWFYYHQQWWLTLSVLGTALLSLSSLGQWYATHVRRLHLSLFTQDDRWQVWQAALSMICDRPLFGWGLGNYKLLYPVYATSADVFSHPHNLWLLLASEAGLPVMLGLTALAAYVSYRAVQVLRARVTMMNPQPLLIGYLLAFAGCGLTALWDCAFYDVQVNATNWIVLGCLYQLVQINTAKNNLINCSAEFE